MWQLQVRRTKGELPTSERNQGYHPYLKASKKCCVAPEGTSQIVLKHCHVCSMWHDRTHIVDFCENWYSEVAA